MDVVYFDQQMHACACVRMVGKQWKTFKNHEKSTFTIMGTTGSCKAHKQKWRKKLVGQGLGVTPKSWWHQKAGCSFIILLFLIIFDCFSTWASHEANQKSKWATSFWVQPAFGSHSQSLTNKLFSSFLFVCLTWASRMHDKKDTLFMIFEWFSLFSLVKIHNKWIIHKLHGAFLRGWGWGPCVMLGHKG